MFERCVNNQVRSFGMLINICDTTVAVDLSIYLSTCLSIYISIDLLIYLLVSIGGEQASPPQNAGNTSTPGTSAAKPEHADALRILMPVAHNWKNIGTFLKLKSSTLDTIETDYRNQSQECLREMISNWLRQTNPRPTWPALAEVVELFDPSLAQRIKTTYCA